MALPAKKQAKYWAIVCAVLLVALWGLGNVILPFVLGGAVAYFLDPVADRLEEMGLGRAAATTLITIAAAMIFIFAILLIVPTIVAQAIDLAQFMPTLFENLGEFSRTAYAKIIERFPSLAFTDTSSGQPTIVQQQLQKLGQVAQSATSSIIESLLSSAAGFVNVLMLMVIVPVVAFYLLLDWDHMVAKIDDMLPRDHAPTVRMIARDIDRTLASFIRGQGTVCLALGTYYAIALMLAGLNFGVVVGAIAGLITFIPYVGALVGGALAIGLALFQFWGSIEVVDGDTVTHTTNWLRIAIIAAIFFIGQFLEGNVLTPKLVGSSVGLHPVWLIFALSAFGSLFGFVGMLVAVPVAAVIGVVARFMIAQYKDSRLYRGLDGNP